MAPIVAAALAAVLFVQAAIRLRRRGRTDLAGWDRFLLFGLALALTLFALVGPLDRLAGTKYLSAHMGQHVLIGDFAPALTMLALRGPMLVFFLPPPIVGPVSRLLHRLRPSVAFALWAVSLAVWHIPYLYDLALSHPALHDFEHLCWLVFGLLVWSILVDRRHSVGRRLALATAMFACGQVLTDVLVFSFHSLYPVYHNERDQQWAGLVMMGEQLLTLGTLAIVLLRPRLRRMHLATA